MDSSTHLQILPLALIMVMGPQILTAIFLVTSRQPVRNSVAMLVGVILAASASVLLWFGLVDLLGVDPKDGGGPTTVDYIVAGLLALLAIRVFMTRGTAETPKWMTTLQEAEPKRAFTLAFLLIFLMPTDIVAVISTVNFLHDNGRDALDGWPLVAATTVLMALPIAAYLLLGHRARDAMPGIRDWLTTNSWVVNLVVIVYFIYQTLS
jgi:Sap, sulfolipid-1-addressing protein